MPVSSLISGMDLAEVKPRPGSAVLEEGEQPGRSGRCSSRRTKPPSRSKETTLAKFTLWLPTVTKNETGAAAREGADVSRSLTTHSKQKIRGPARVIQNDLGQPSTFVGRLRNRA